MKKMISLLLALCLLIGCAALFVSCDKKPTGDGDDTHTCVDTDKDGKCDVCGKTLGGKPGGKDDEHDPDEGSPYSWDTTSLTVQMTHTSNKQQLPSGCLRYLAGEDTDATEQIDDMIAERNAAAASYANVKVTYLYYPDTTEYAWAQNVERIYDTVMSKDKNAPDIYVNMVYDMVAASLKGAFANLYSTSRGTGDLRGANYFSFNDPSYDEDTDNRGYMYDLMTTFTLSKFKMYLLASDYCIDIVRGFLVVPVNVKLMNSVVGEVLGDYNKDGVSNLDDFYDMVKNGEWSYAMMAEFADAIYMVGGESTSGTMLTDERVGFAVSRDSGLPAVGLLYTSSVIIIHRDWDETREDYKYYYPETNEDLEAFCASLKMLFETTGVMSLSDSEYTSIGQTSGIAVRNRFAQNHLLFGGVIAVGSLEYDVYQDMKDGVGVSEKDLETQNYGFGVAPVPIYKTGDGERYLTQTDGGCGKPLGIAATTTKFAQCTAWLDYQSTHSTDILNEYYDYKLQYDVAGGTPGNVYILQYIRRNVRTAFDFTFEEAIGNFFGEVDGQARYNEWHQLIRASGYRMTNIAEKYSGLYPSKAKYLSSLVDEYDKLPD